MARNRSSFHADQMLRKHAARLELLNDIARKIGQAHDVDEVLQRAAQLTQQLFNYQHVGIFLIDREHQVLLMSAIAGEYARFFSAIHILDINQGMVGWVCNHGRSLLANDVRLEPSYINLYPDDVHTLSELTIPIRLDGEIMGVLDIQSSSLNAFDGDDLIVEETLAEQIAIALKNAWLYQSLEQELAERKQVEQSLRESERKLTTLLSNLPGMTYRCQNDQFWTMEFVSQGALGLTGYPPSAFLCNNQISYAELIHPENRQMIWDTVQEAVLLRKPFDLVYRITTASGEAKWVMERGRGIFSTQNELQAIEGFITDITERMQMDAQLKASLVEKEVLLKEVHHRVKNNLEVIISLADMQARLISDPTAIHGIRELQERVRTIALVHEDLYRSKNLAKIHADTYLMKLIDNLFQVFGSTGIDLHVDAANLELNIDMAVPFGLIVTELLTNALKYAFPGRDEIKLANQKERPNRIDLILSEVEQQYILEIRDNGIGLPPDLDWRNTRSLGLRLVNRLAEQLHGNLEVNICQGTCFRLTLARPNGGVTVD